MTVLVNSETRVLVQGITGSQGQLHTRGCRDYGTNIVSGVTPGKGGQDFEGVLVLSKIRQEFECALVFKQVQDFEGVLALTQIWQDMVLWYLG